jgi:uncharacterized repeat protein (TIGR03843 family)
VAVEDHALVNPWRAADPHVENALRDAEISDLRLVYHSSNYVFIAWLEHPDYGRGLGVYKPARGEQPLWDFPDGLFRREIAAYEFARLLGWPIVPPTVERDGPHGRGSMQLFIEHDPRQHYFELRDQDGYDEQLVRFAVYDLVANNADRKGGHVLRDEDDHLWGIDHGLCFHEEAKLRTVIWDYAGTELPEAWLDDLRRVRDCIAAADPDVAALTSLLSTREQAALVARVDELLSRPVLPEMYPWRCVPWPMV